MDFIEKLSEKEFSTITNGNAALNKNFYAFFKFVFIYLTFCSSVSESTGWSDSILGSLKGEILFYKFSVDFIPVVDLLD